VPLRPRRPATTVGRRQRGRGDTTCD